jgi:exodeoxyribonuclease VII small subunit
MAKKEITYQEALAEIEELGVDDLSERVKRVTFLLKVCKQKLRKTQQEVDDVLKEMSDNEA